MDEKLNEFNKFYSLWLANPSEEASLGLLYSLVWCLRVGADAEKPIKTVKSILPHLIRYMSTLDPGYVTPLLIKFKEKYNYISSLDDVSEFTEDDLTSYLSSFYTFDVAISSTNLAYNLSLMHPIDLRINRLLGKMKDKMKFIFIPIRQRPLLFLPAATIVSDFIINEDIVYVSPADFHYYQIFDLIEKYIDEDSEFYSPDVIIKIDEIRKNSAQNVLDCPELCN